MTPNHKFSKKVISKMMQPFFLRRFQCCFVISGASLTIQIYSSSRYQFSKINRTFLSTISGHKFLPFTGVFQTKKTYTHSFQRPPFFLVNHRFWYICPHQSSAVFLFFHKRFLWSYPGADWKILFWHPDRIHGGFIRLFWFSNNEAHFQNV